MSSDAASPTECLPKVLAEHRPPWKPILRKRPPFDLRHDPRGKKSGAKTQRAIHQEICGEPPDALLIVEEYCQKPEEQLTETEEQRNKNRKAPACSDSSRAHKNSLHLGFPDRFIRCRVATWTRQTAINLSRCIGRTAREYHRASDAAGDAVGGDWNRGGPRRRSRAGCYLK
jgi:hypothetical protein